MIVKWNNNIVDYKCKGVFFFSKCYKSILFFYVGLCLKKKKKKKREHATYDIRDSYYKPVAPVLCWCNPPGSAPSHLSGSRTRVSGAGCGCSNKERQRRLTRHMRTFFFCCFLWFSLSSLRFLPPGVGLTGSFRPSKVLLEFKALILKTEHKQTLQSVVMLDCIERILIGREDISHLG